MKPLKVHIHEIQWLTTDTPRYNSTILDLDARWREASVQVHAPVALPWGRSPWNPVDRRLSVPQSQSGHHKVEQKLLPLLGIKPRSSS
jgi:hypothetical protein